MTSKRTPAAVLLLASAAAVALYAGYRTWTAEPVTGPHELVWLRADGSPLPPNDMNVDKRPRCEGPDINFKLAVWERGLIAHCGEDPKGWAFIDPAAGKATVRWPLAAKHDSVTLAIVPGPDHQLAMLSGSIDNDHVLVGIGTLAGWVRVPELVEHFRFTAAAWVGDQLEVVGTDLTGLTGEWMDIALAANRRPYSVLTFGPHGRAARVAKATCATADCYAPQIVYRAGGHWIFETSNVAITETGEAAPPAFGGDSFGHEIDQTAQGTLTQPSGEALGHPTKVLQADGSVKMGPPLPSGVVPGQLVDIQRYAIDDHGIVRRPLWFLDRDFSIRLEIANGRRLVWTAESGEDLVRVTDDASKLATMKPVGKMSSGLVQTIIPDDKDGYWFVDVATGAVLHLDHDLLRSDPLPLREHLRQRGSLGSFIDEPEHPRKLGWALFGLPLLLVVAGIIGGVRRRFPTGALMVAAVIYLITAGICLSDVLPLLS